MRNKVIWLPDSITKVVYQDGQIYVRDEMVMKKQHLKDEAFFQIDKNILEKEEEKITIE